MDKDTANIGDRLELHFQINVVKRLRKFTFNHITTKMGNYSNFNISRNKHISSEPV